MFQRSAVVQRALVLFPLLMGLLLSARLCPSALGVERAAAGPLSAKVNIGDKITGATFKDIRYLPRSLDELIHPKDPQPTKAIVLVFTNTTCPLVQRYLPRLKELDAEFGKRGAKFVSVNVSPTESLTDVATQAVEFGIPFAAVQDIDGSTVAACGVTRTPEVVVLDSEFRLRYRGRIDDQYRLGGARPSATRSYLREAVEAVIADREVEVTETPVDGCYITAASSKPVAKDLTFHEHIRPLMAKHCQYCHQPGTTAPFSLITYDDVAGNAEMIAEVVAEQRMPPWYASPKHGEFLNERVLDRHDRNAIVEWVRAGAPEGDPTKAQEVATDEMQNDYAPDPEWGNQRWWLGKPDMILTVPGTYEVPADGYVDYKYAVLPHAFLQDTWLLAAEVQPDNPRVVHHANLGYLKIGTSAVNARLITGYVPGVGPMVLSNGVASKIPAGSAVGLQIHLTTTGKPEKTRLRVGFRFPREKVQQQLHYLQLSNTRFAIPPHASHHPVSRTKGVDEAVTVYGFFAHMHLRGKDATFLAHPPQGPTQTLLTIPNYSFDWQLPYYVKPGTQRFPAGTQFECVAHYDNSTFNPYNPDPSVTVRDGQQTIQEMMYGYVFYTKDAEQLDLEVNPHDGTEKNRGLLKSLLGTSASPSKSK